MKDPVLLFNFLIVVESTVVNKINFVVKKTNQTKVWKFDQISGRYCGEPMLPENNLTFVISSKINSVSLKISLFK